MRGARGWLVSLAIAFQFLTILPSLIRRDLVPGEVGRAVCWFPLVGLAIGLVLVGVDLLISPWLPPLVSSALLVAFSIVLTGGLHFDGLMDCADGLFGGRDPEHRLEIMRDSRAGSFGVLAGSMVLILQVAALSSLSGSLRQLALLTAPLLGRIAMVLGICTIRYVRPAGLGRWFSDYAPRAVAVLGSAVLLAGTIVAGGRAGVLAVIGAAAAAAAAYAFAWQRIGGATGDVYGATGVIAETAVLITLSATVAG